MKFKIELLEQDIEMLESQQTYGITLNTWYKNKDNTMFFKPSSIEDGVIIGFSITMEKHYLANNIYDDTVSLEYYFSNMKESSYGEVLNGVNSHNLEVLKQHK